MPGLKNRLHYFLLSSLIFVILLGSLFTLFNQQTSAQPITTEAVNFNTPPTFDLQITKSVTPTSGPPGTIVTYTLTISNNGPQVANELLISDTLPAEMVVTRIDTGGDFVTQTITPTLSWSYFTLNSGEQDQLTITGIISPGLVDGVILTNTAVISQSIDRPLPVLMGGGICPFNSVSIGGSNVTLLGNIHSNGDVNVSGGGLGHTITGFVTYGTSTNLPNVNTTLFPTINNPSQVPSRNYPISYYYADFVPPNGYIYQAIVAANPSHYHFYNGQITTAVMQAQGWMVGSVIEEGVYVAPGGFDFNSVSGLIGDGVTFISQQGKIDFCCSAMFRPYFGGLLMMTEATGDPCDNNKAIYLTTSSNIDWGGIIYAPNGSVGMNSPGGSFYGSIIAGAIAVSGADLFMTADQQYKSVESDFSNNTAEATFTLILTPTFDLEITKSVTPTTGPPGTAVTYTITISNNGPEIANNLIISDTLPPELVMAHIDTGGSFITQSITPTLSWSYTSLLPGQQDSLTITGIISPSVINGTTITNTAVITHSPNATLPLIFAGGQCPSNEVDINGSALTFLGNIHSNGDVNVTGGGQGNVITGYVTYGTGTNLPNPNTTLTPTIDNPSQVPPRSYPIDLAYADFVWAAEPNSNGSNGWAYEAIIASNPARYHYYAGQITMSVLQAQGWITGTVIERGVYVTPVGFKFSGTGANGLVGDGITFVTLGSIDLSGSQSMFRPFFADLLLLTEGFGDPCGNNAAIKYSGASNFISGIFFAPHGSIYASPSSNSTISGSLIAGMVDVTGSSAYYVNNQSDNAVDSDPSNNTAEAPFTFILPYPTADPGGPYNVDEGSSIQLDASASSGINLSSFDWDLDNDGMYDDASGITVTFGNTTDDALYPIGLQVSNSYGFTDTAVTSITVNNVAPILINLLISPTITGAETITLTGAIVDPGVQDTFTVTIDWAGEIQQTILYPAGTTSFTVPFTHTQIFAASGTYTITVTVTDDDGGEDSGSINLIVPPYKIYMPVVRRPN